MADKVFQDTGAAWSPPQAIEAEQACIAAMLLGGTGAVEQARRIVSGNHFLRQVHQAMFDEMAWLVDNGRAVDTLTLKQRLQDAGVWDLIGGAEYFFAITDILPSAAGVEHYARIVKEKWARRHLFEQCHFYSRSALDEDQETGDLLDGLEQLASECREGRADKTWASLPALLPAAINGAERRRERGGDVTGVRTGLAVYDRILSGLNPGLHILAARPSMGKTAAALSIALNAAVRGYSVAFFSLEMSKGEIANRSLAALARVSLRRIQAGLLDERQWTRLAAAKEMLRDAPIYVDDEADIDMAEIRSRCRMLRKEMGGLDLVIVDYLQLLADPKGSRESMYERVGEKARLAKALAKELRIPCLLLSQLSRQVEQREDKRPLLSDLAESGKVEAHADAVTFLYRPAYYARETGDFVEGAVDTVEMIVAKQRNGPTGTAIVEFVPDQTLFQNRGGA